MQISERVLFRQKYYVKLKRNEMNWIELNELKWIDEYFI